MVLLLRSRLEPSTSYLVGRVAVCIAVLPLLFFGAGCATLRCHATSPASTQAMPAYTERHDLGPRPVLVFQREPGAPPAGVVFLLHEISGFTAATAAFAGRLAEKGFTVYAPIMLGTALEQGRWAPTRNFLEVCLGPDWPTLRTNKNPAVLPDLRLALRNVRALHPNEAIGIIGMCMTGTLPLALMNEPGVRIAAVCQPALPMLAWTDRRKRNLALTEDELKAAFAHINSEHQIVLGFRFQGDGISTAERLEEIRDRMKKGGGCYRDYQIKREEENESRPKHATFTSDYGSPATVKRLDDLVREFRQALSRPR